MRIFTIGYEGTTVGEFLAALQQAGVERLIDVRAVPNSRRPGFLQEPASGRAWRRAHRICPPARARHSRRGRAAARAGRIDDLIRIYMGQLELPEAMAQAAQMLELAAEKPSALLCYERQPEHCHRTLLLDAVAPDAQVVHVFD